MSDAPLFPSLFPPTREGGGGHGGSLLTLLGDGEAVVLWGALVRVMRAELWSCVCGVLAPSEQLPQCCSLLSGEAGLAGRLWTVIDAFPSIFPLHLRLMGKSANSMPGFRGYVGTLQPCFGGFLVPRCAEDAVFAWWRLIPSSQRHSLCSSLVLGCAFAEFCKCPPKICLFSLCFHT